MDDSTLDRLRKEVDAQDGTDVDAPDLTKAEWAKVKAHAEADYGSPVTVVWRGDHNVNGCSVGFTRLLPMPKGRGVCR